MILEKYCNALLMITLNDRILGENSYKKKCGEICTTLVERANNNGGRDNVTVIVSLKTLN